MNDNKNNNKRSVIIMILNIVVMVCNYLISILNPTTREVAMHIIKAISNC